MKLTAVATAKKKLKPTLGIFFLMFLLSGCVTPVGYKAQTLKCSEAEEAVNQAEKEYDAATAQLTKKPKDADIKTNFSGKMKNLQEAQQKAFLVCNPGGRTVEKE